MTEELDPREFKRMKVAYGRRFGATPEHREWMAEKNDQMVWHGTCRRCGQTLKGTPETIRAHKCDGSPST